MLEDDIKKERYTIELANNKLLKSNNLNAKTDWLDNQRKEMNQLKQSNA